MLPCQAGVQQKKKSTLPAPSSSFNLLLAMEAFSLRPDGAASLDRVNNQAQGLTNLGSTGGQLSPLMSTCSREGLLHCETDFGTTLLTQHSTMSASASMVSIHS